MSDTSSSGLSRHLETIAPRVAPPPDVYNDLDQIAENIKGAKTSWDFSQQAALAIAAMAQQSAAIGGVLNSVVGVATSAQAAAINVSGRIASGNVTIDGLSKDANAAFYETLSKSGTAWWAEADERIGKFGAAIAGWDVLAGGIRDELSCICRHAAVIARQLCGEEYLAIYAEVCRNGAGPPPGPRTARGATHEPNPDHRAVALGHEITALIERLRERTETRFAELESARLVAAERDREQHEHILALRAWQEDQRQRLERLAGTLDTALADRELSDALLGLEARIETRLADIAAEREAQARRAADTYDRVLVLLERYEPLRERLADIPETLSAVMEARVGDMLARMEARLAERMAHAREAEVEQTRAALAALRHDQGQTKLRLAELTKTVAAEAQALEAAGSAALESGHPPGGRGRAGAARK